MKFYITLLLSSTLFTVFAQAPTDYFITKWDLNKLGSPGANSIKLDFTITGDVNYTWETIPAGISGSGILTGTSSTLTGFPAYAMIRLKIDPSNFKRLIFYDETNPTSARRLVDIEQWGTVNWSSMNQAFYDCDNLNITATDMPNLTNVADLSYMFYNCLKLNGPPNINLWDISKITNVERMFSRAVLFNQPIGNWNTSNITNMKGMFYSSDLNYGNSVFNQTIENWDTSKVTNMSYMFTYCKFNQPIESWNISNVTNMEGMFGGASFNQPIDNWNTSNVTNMKSMFASAISFNQPIGNWDVSKVTDMGQMFINAFSFNQPIDNWDTSNVNNMTDMFHYATSFNQPIGNWNTSNVKYMCSMFENATSFNQPIGNWDTSNVMCMGSMFQKATSFNQAIGNWNTSNVTNMPYMFEDAALFNQPIGNWATSSIVRMENMFNRAIAFNQPLENWNVLQVYNMQNMFNGATAFNQNIGNWNLNPNVTMINMLNNSGIDCNNYTDTIIGWSNNVNTPNNRSLGAVGMDYGMNALPNRDILISGKGWTITGDNQFSGNCGSLAVEDFSEKTFEIYPNPADNFIIVNTEESGIGTIFNSLGQTIKTINLENSKIIDVSDLPTGVYTLQLKNNGKNYCKKIIKK